MRAAISQIILAQEPDFHLGGLLISPSTLQVVGHPGSAKARTLLQPRIMQVLVALARRRGEVVSRDDMMAVCWGGFAVSDDAINRCIARLRRLAESQGGFRLETIPRVGYQLSEEGAPAPTPELAPAPVAVIAPVWAARHGLVAGVAFATGVLLTAALFAGARFLGG